MKQLKVTSKLQPSGLHFTTNHTGKMQGIFSLSTSVNDNAQCAKNAKIAGSICSHCFAAALFARYPESVENAFINNGKILRGGIIPTEYLPIVNNDMFRFESFGDIANLNQARNYLNLAKKNPQTSFAWFTKNPHILARLFEEEEKPANVQVILSSLFINKPVKTKYTFVDKIFTVYDKTRAKDVNINCGARCCRTCKKCYTCNPEKGKIQYINELIK